VFNSLKKKHRHTENIVFKLRKRLLFKVKRLHDFLKIQKMLLKNDILRNSVSLTQNRITNSLIHPV